ncbi:MAG TPA: sigma-54 dependent transcriptional regulator [Cyclobacteriaceae bacterium]|nr:sigma-54-dependent Fis family transcriptional regulator [Cyclobacteriaceae bacterium]MCB9238713.1 sigma-54-dependent Fis family transcriptional regulator [Flammeovirgaceae bacterium]MCB0497989.1 sigma-54-dependent Fis family transcriptional regulator [Cyclobacteriaceae bacterium]MCO5270431.1 sigma-54 dependent transcriptional regulator [Cyclobacteriaceae bacterium]MCW5901127.1 sigma-54-dependent Fis family transcriptional regulator [Cyclobacteriaceae bacterium]
MPKVLLIEDEASIRTVLKEIITDQKELKLTVDEARDGAEGLAMLEDGHYDLVFCDIKMPKMDGMEVLQKAREKGIGSTFIMVSAHGTTEMAVDATKMGAYDFLQKPPDLNRLLITLRNALDKTHLVAETKTLKKKIAHKLDMVGESEAITQVKEMIEKVAPTDARVLITGPNGSGKELVARWVHEKSHRASAPFVEVNCAAIPSELIESELFGHEKGSFTSAIKQRIGKFEQADNGTLFLDEIGDMGPSAQAKVLRALQENKITRVGGDKDIAINVRVLAATNKDLKKAISENKFREDLYHRLGVIIIKVPALNERREDIPLLVDKFLNDLALEQGSKPKTMDAKALKEIQNYNWTGNIRELRNVVERLTIMSEGKIGLEEVKKYL